MKYELDVLAALTQLTEPTTQDIVAATGMSERKVQNVINFLHVDLQIGIERVKTGRNIRYRIKDWGVFESGNYLKRALVNRALTKNKKRSPSVVKALYYESVKMDNFKESSRLEGISIRIDTTSVGKKKTIAGTRRALVRKYSKYKKH